MTGKTFGPYQILEKLGEGGMGQVYRARDTKLQRDVAIKVLPESVATNPRRLARFEREARSLAVLNHPNIAAVYGVEDTDSASTGGRAIVMEFVAGEDLSARLKRGAIPADEALPIARQVAEALAAAHEAGIVHRDLKPANIKIRPDGAVKILDFGLAKSGTTDIETGSAPGTSSGSGSGSDELPNTLTVVRDVTEDGAVLGTAAYMSPEQAKGKLVDKRADIWSFGVVLFEMLTGRRPFVASDATETIAQVLATDPDWTALPADTSASIRRLLARCLTKDRRQRLHDIADARLEIDDAIDRAEPAPVSTRTGFAWPGLIGILGIVVGLAAGMLWWRTQPAAPVVTHARLDVAPAGELNAGGIGQIVLAPGGAHRALEWSPDGRTLAFIGMTSGVRQIFLRDLASAVARPLAGTEGAAALTFSSSGDEIAFWANNRIGRIKTAGGPVEKLWETNAVQGFSWGPSRLIVATSQMIEITSSTTDVRRLTMASELVRQASPFLLARDKALLYTEHEKQWTSGDERVMVLPLAPGSSPRVLLKDAADARYLSTGHLAFLRQGTLFVVPFDAEALELRGEPIAVIKDVGQASSAWDSDDLSLAGQYAVSPQGMLAYVSSPPVPYPDRELVSISRDGVVSSLGAPAKGYRNHLEVSPDGTRLAVSVQTATDIRLFSYDLARHTLSRIADAMKGEAIVGAWSRNNGLAVDLTDGGKVTTVIAQSDTGSSTLTIPDTASFWASSISPRGHIAGVKGGDIWIYPVKPDDGRPFVLAKTAAGELHPTFSPDGTWLAYSSDATGRSEVYLRPYPGPGEAIMVSANSGSAPVWNPNSRELFYLEHGSTTNRMMSVKIPSPGRAENAVPLFTYSGGSSFMGPGILASFAVSKDGRSFYAVRNLPRTIVPITEINIVLNWFEELKTKLR